ncbi:MAG: lysophospholipid acyltransferase family protein [Acidimicrobiia bacterium]|nr:MAG: lysophospholipid acyltransferase family protein [Acidimicrobiia bacterium]
MLRTLLAGIRTFVLVPLFFLLTLLFAIIIVIYGAVRPAAPIHDKILKLWSRLWLRIPPAHVDVVGTEKVDPHQRYIVVSNHLSMLDIPLLFQALPLHGRFLAKQEIFKIPVVAQAMRTIGMIEIDRGQGGSSRRAINEGVRIAAERGYSLLIFPEGTRSTEGELLPFKKGAFRIAIDTGLPLLPVVIEGTERISRPGSRLFFPGHASMRILSPIDTADMTNKNDLRPLSTLVESEMNAVYREMRAFDNRQS